MGDKASRGAFNEVLRTPKHQEQPQDTRSDVLTWKKQRSIWDQSFKVKTPPFILEQKGKTGILRGYCGVQKFNKVKEANTILRSPYTQMIKPERQAMATSMAHYKRGPHCRGKVSERGLALT